MEYGAIDLHKKESQIHELRNDALAPFAGHERRFREVFATLFPGATEIAETFSYFQVNVSVQAA